MTQAKTYKYKQLATFMKSMDFQPTRTKHAIIEISKKTSVHPLDLIPINSTFLIVETNSFGYIQTT